MHVELPGYMQPTNIDSKQALHRARYWFPMGVPPYKQLYYIPSYVVGLVRLY